MRRLPEFDAAGAAGRGSGLAADATRRNHFGAGADAPYDVALSAGEGVLRLIEQGGDGEQKVDFARFLAPADDADASVIGRARGAVLDIGCGPGRMVRAAIVAGHLSLGIDVSSVAVARAAEQGLPVLRRSVFDPLPREGEWDTVLLLDGNIGIAGDPEALLRRAGELLADSGRMLVEVHADEARDRGFTARLLDEAGRTSLPFPWHEVGLHGLRSHARRAGLIVAAHWSRSGRVFACLIADPASSPARP